MSLSGLTQSYIPNTLDGLNVIEADQIYINGVPVELDNLVPYTGATQTLNMGAQNIQTSHAPVASNDVVNLVTLQNAVTYVDNSVALTYLNKISGVAQTVAGPVTYDGAQTSNEKDYLYKGQRFIGGSTFATSWDTDVIDGPSAGENPLQFKHFQTDKKVIFRADGKIYSEALGVSKALVSDASGNIVSSGVDASKIDYLDNVSSDIQTQLNNRLKLDGSNANTNIVIGSYKVQSSATPSTGDDYTNKTYVDSAISTAGAGYLPLSGGTLSGPLTISSGALTANTRLLGVPDGASNGNFWIGLTGSDTEVNRLAIDIIGNQTTGTVSKVTISKPLYLSDPTVNRVLAIDSQNKVFSTIVSTTEIAYLSGVTNSIQTQLDTKASTTYVNSQDNLRVLKAGDEMTGHLYNTGGEFWPYKAGDVNKSCRLFANNGDGADYTSYNGGLKSWYGIAFYCTNDSTVRHVFNTRDGSSKQTGQIDCGSLTTDGTITTTGIGTNAGVLAKRYYLTARGDNQDEDSKVGDNKFGPWYGVGDSGIPGFTGNPCLAGFYGCALRSGSGYLVLTGGGKVGIGSTNPSSTLTVTGDISCSSGVTASSLSAKNWVRQNDYRTGMKPSQQDAGSMGYYFGVMNNDDTGSYTDMLCFNSWADSSAGKVNLIMFNKGGKGIRQYQGDFGSTSLFSTWYDCVMTDANSGNVGIAGQLSIGLNSNTTPNIKFANARCHIDDSAGEAYLFTGYNGHISIGRNTTRNATTCNLALGVASTDEAQIISIATDNSTYLPMSFASSRYTFTGGGSVTLLRDQYGFIHKNSTGTISMATFIGGAINGGYIGTVTNHPLAFYTNDSSAQMILKTNGCVGIGTTNPLSSLYSYNAGTSGWKGWGYFGNEERGAVIGTYDNKVYVGGHTASLNAWQDMYLNPGGKVCIGNYPMTYKLNVEGDMYATGAILFGSSPGVYTNGCIYSDVNWGCIIRARQFNPSIAHFLWSDAYSNDLMRITNNGVLNFNGGATASAINTGQTNIPGQVVIGGVNQNYNGNWGSGLLMECSETTSITVHDSGEKLASFMYYDTDNRFYMGKDLGNGWGATPIQIESTLYYSNPPAWNRGAQAGYGAVLGWDVIDKRVMTTTIEGYHFGPYSDNLQVNWNYLSRASQFYKSNSYQGLLIHGVATSYRDSAGFQNVTLRLYNQSTGQYFYFATYIYTNLSYNHSPIPFFFDGGGLPAGWYDAMFYINSGYGFCDGNDAISASFLLLPISLTSP